MTEEKIMSERYEGGEPKHVMEPPNHIPKAMMSTLQGKWIKVEQKGVGPGARSSHAIAMVGRKAYAFGGEQVPRLPVDNHLHVFNFDDLSWSVANVWGDVPPPRVGVTMTSVGDTIYVFGGRDEKHEELNELYSFHTCSGKWTLLSSTNGGPQPRSYHSMTSDDRYVYVFGGCGGSNAGRLNDLWGFDIVEGNWREFGAAGDSCRGRGGAGFATVGGKVWVVYGFCGDELDDVHCFDPARGEWCCCEVVGQKPTGRSVFSSGAIGKNILICGGEIHPSEEGHLGAGKFSSEVYALDTQTLSWKRWEKDEGMECPGERGWCAYSLGKWCDGRLGLLVYGGNSPSNDRLDDLFFFIPALDQHSI